MVPSIFLDEMFSTNLQQSRSFGSSFKFPEGEGSAPGAGAQGGAQFGQENEECVSCLNDNC